LLFLDSLEDQTMTSTASRLATVQRAIELLEVQLSRSQSDRERAIQARIDLLADELKAVQAGVFDVLDGKKAEEGIREVYQLAMSLQADFRRVEDSYREADRQLRQRIISENQNRGQIVDELLNGHEQLVQTIEGQVFESFYAQLVKSSELQEMKSRIRSILENANSDKALSRKQRAELKQLVSRLVYESERVIQARSHSERDVRGFLKSGLANEQLRVGALLQDIFQTALELDWQDAKIRRTESPLPPLAISASNLPLIERLLPKQIEGKQPSELELDEFQANPAEMGDEFWRAYRALDREELFRRTLEKLQQSGEKLTIGQLAKSIVPTHDLETLAFWLAMARQAGVELGEGSECFDLVDSQDGTTRFDVPWVELTGQDVRDLKVESLE
jgi:predicted flap endonuclease-1-like 5' DNA nuclease